MKPSSTPTTVSAAVGGTSTAAAAGVLIVWILSLNHIVVPPDVALAIVALVAAGLHWVAAQFGGVDPVPPQPIPPLPAPPGPPIIIPSEAKP